MRASATMARMFRPLFTLMLLSGCALVPIPKLVAQPPVDRNVSESFYAAHVVRALHSFAEQSAKTAPNAAVTHEVLAQLAQLDGDDDRAFEELMAALVDSSDDAALLHVHLLGSTAWTRAHRARALALMEGLAQNHPDAEVRAAATFYSAHQLSMLGELDERDRLIASLPGRIPLALVGTWDNEQGKGFDEELGPELKPGLVEKYPGRSHELSWRLDAPTDPRGRYDLTALMQPNRWAVVYGQGTFTVPQAGDWALRLTSTDPVKVWLDGKPVFATVHLDESVFDNIVVPVTVSAGTHTVMIKSAQREGTWLLALRATPASDDERVVPVLCKEGMTPYPGGDPRYCSAPARVDGMRSLLEWRIRGVIGAERRSALLSAWAKISVGGLWAVQLADAWVEVEHEGHSRAHCPRRCAVVQPGTRPCGRLAERARRRGRRRPALRAPSLHSVSAAAGHEAEGP